MLHGDLCVFDDLVAARTALAVDSPTVVLFETSWGDRDRGSNQPRHTLSDCKFVGCGRDRLNWVIVVSVLVVDAQDVDRSGRKAGNGVINQISERQIGFFVGSTVEREMIVVVYEAEFGKGAAASILDTLRADAGGSGRANRGRIFVIARGIPGEAALSIAITAHVLGASLVGGKLLTAAVVLVAHLLKKADVVLVLTVACGQDADLLRLSEDFQFESMDAVVDDSNDAGREYGVGHGKRVIVVECMLDETRYKSRMFML